jgi:hypothetical protein
MQKPCASVHSPDELAPPDAALQSTQISSNASAVNPLGARRNVMVRRTPPRHNSRVGVNTHAIRLSSGFANHTSRSRLFAARNCSTLCLLPRTCSFISIERCDGGSTCFQPSAALTRQPSKASGLGCCEAQLLNANPSKRALRRTMLQFSSRTLRSDARRGRIMKWSACGDDTMPIHGPLQLLVRRHYRRLPGWRPSLVATFVFASG